MTGHEWGVRFSNPWIGGIVYDYDPAEDGPEVEVITRVFAKHSPRDLVLELKN